MNKVFKNRIFIAFVALILAIICGVVFYVTTTATSSTISAIKITATVPKGTMITDSMVKVEEIGGYNLGDVLTNKGDVVGKYATSDLMAGDLILPSKVSSSVANSNDKLSNLDGSKSAISVTIKTFADGLSDKLTPGDIVSCIVTDQNKKTTTPAELTYLEVLAVTQKNGVDKQSDKKSETNNENMATVTVLAAPKQAELLANYDNTSDVHFALVYRGDPNTAKQFIEKQDSVLH